MRIKLAPELNILLELNSVEQILQHLKNLSPQQRKIYSGLLPKAIKDTSKNYFDWDLPEEIRETERLKLNKLSISLYSICSFTEIKKAGWISIPEFETMKCIIEHFQPNWINKWAHWVLEQNPRRFDLIFPLFKSGYCDRPKSDNYVSGMIESINYLHIEDQSLEQSIRMNLNYIEDEIWRLFEIEGGGEFSLAAHDKYAHTNNNWQVSLRVLAEDGTLSKERLLDACLEALGRDFSQFRSGWYSRFFNALKPDLEEINSRVDKLLLIIGSRIPPTVSFALKHLFLLHKNGLLKVNDFIKNVQPSLNARSKTTVMLSLKILANMAKSNPQNHHQIAQASIGALLYDDATIQTQVFDLIDTYGKADDATIIEYLAKNQSFVLPSLKPRLQHWIAANEQEGIVSATPESISATPSNDAVLVQYKSTNISQINCIEELLAQLSHLIEVPENPVDIERVLDGICRLCRDKTSQFVRLVSPLKKRATSLIKRGPGKWLTFQLSRLALSMIENTNYFADDFKKFTKQKTADFETVFVIRLYYLIENIIAHPLNGVPMISMPTHDRGFINPAVLPGRIQARIEYQESDNLVDSALTILRLKPELIDCTELDAIIHQLQTINTDFSLACAYALGAEIKVGHIPALWMAASRIRFPGANDNNFINKFGDLGPDAGSSALYTSRVRSYGSGTTTFYALKVDCTPPAPAKIPLEHLSVLFHLKVTSEFGHAYFGLDSGLVRWGSTIWPGNLEPYFSCGAQELSIIWPEAQWQVQSYFLPLLQADVPLTPMALLLVIAGLSSSEPGQRGIAIDIVIMKIEEDRIDISQLGKQMASLITTGIIIVSRWTKAIKEIASISKIHAEAMRILIQSLLQFKPENSPRYLGGLLELLYEIQVALNKQLDNKNAIAFCKANKKSGKIGQFSKKLLNKPFN